MSLKQERLATLIQKYITDIVQFELKDKQLGIITITNVKVSDDNSWAKVYVTFLDEKKEEKLEILKKSKGFIRSKLAKKLTIRRSPDLVFEIDNSFEKGKRIDDLLKEINKD